MMDLREAASFHHSTLYSLNRSPQTIRLYRVYQASFIAFLDEQDLEPTLEALNPQFVRNWQAWMRSRSTGRRGGLVSEKQGVLVLRTWARFLTDSDVYPFDPLGRLKVPRVPKIKRKPFTEDEVRRLIQATAMGPFPVRDRSLLLLLLDTGCRIGELCHATVADVDLVEGAITFGRTKTGNPRTVRFRVPNARDGGACLAALKMWMKVREAHPGVEAVFTTRERWPMSPRRAREVFAKLGADARVPDCHPHRFRTTSASEFLASQPGAEIQLRSRLGHVSRDVLSDYVSISDPTAAAAAEVASISTKWNLGSGSPVPARRDRALPAPRGRKAAAAPPAVDETQALLDRVAADPALLRGLLEQLLKRGGA